MTEIRIRDDEATLSACGRDVSGLKGRAEAAVRLRDEADAEEALVWARSRGMSVLPVGGQTSTTGASVPDGGLLVDLSALHRPPQIDEQAMTVSVTPGTGVQALRDCLQAQGFDLPVDPTSASECTIAGAIATNASGAASYRYGAMGAWVRSIDLLDGRGRRHKLRRPQVEKCGMGPPSLQDPTRFAIGSEGTLGMILGATLAIHRPPEARLGALFAFEERKALIDGVIALRAVRDRLAVRCVEWLDGACCELLRPHAAGVCLPESQAGGVYIEVEGQGGEERAFEGLELAMEVLDAAGADVHTAQLFRTGPERAHFAALRHRVPDTINRRGAALTDEAGGGKLSTDWSVPLHALEPLLAWSEEALAPLGLVGLWAYGHIGNGHPHLNLLCSDLQMKQDAQPILAEQLRRVVQAGGSPISEHGIGKLKRDLIAPHLPPGFASGLAGLKRHFDPDGVFAPGNLVSANALKT